jgi:SAM-dependent methyltransferase
VAHHRYFTDASVIIAQIFNREPLDAQPHFVLDVGCGDGSWLARIFKLVGRQTLRGRHLDRYPLKLIGVDHVPAALGHAQAALAAVGADALFLFGDVGNPDALRDALASHGLKIADGLHLHAFVDHDRSFRGGAPGAAFGQASGAYLDDRGCALGAAEIEADLAAHLGRWEPHIGRHGMIVLEGHRIAPRTASRHLGAVHCLAFEAYHAYSRQYPVERRAFVAALRLANLRQAATGTRHYPATRPFVAVSIDHILGSGSDDLLAGSGAGSPRTDNWRADPAADLRDGLALHKLLYEGGDLRHPRFWCAAATNALVTRAMRVLEERAASLSKGDVLRVCDYGSGTGLAATELLKACRERGLEDRLARRGASLELHLLDIPSSWFAQGYALLSASSWTHFHSLVDENGRFRPLLEVTEGQRMDVILSSMVFHLIRPQALARVAGELADLAAPGGRLFWNSPDLGPAGPWAVLFHDPNRALRAQWKALLTGTVIPASRAQREAVAAARRDRNPRSLVDDARADRRILARPHRALDVAETLAAHFVGEVSTQLHEMNEAEVLDALLVPSNQEEFLPEIADARLREIVIGELMGREVLPGLRASPAGSDLGHNVQWTFGDCGRSAVG